MRGSLLRRWLVVGAVVAVGGFVAERAGLAAAAGVDFWNLPHLERTLEECEQVEARLEAESDAVALRIDIKEALIRDLIAGRTTLEQVTERFLALNRTRPVTMTVLRRVYGTLDERELIARNVIDYATRRRSLSPAARAELVRRLDAEFARLFPAVGALAHQ